MMTSHEAVAHHDTPAIDRYPSRWRALRSQPWWRWVSRGAALAFLLMVATLVIFEARKIQWHEVLATIRRMPSPALLMALALAATSHTLYSSFDLVGRHYTGHK